MYCGVLYFLEELIQNNKKKRKKEKKEKKVGCERNGRRND